MHAWRFLGARMNSPERIALAWRRGAFEVLAFTGDTYAVRVPERRPCVLPAFAVEFALACEEFRPLPEHLREYAATHHFGAEQTEALGRALPGLAEAGVLVAAADLRARLATMHGAPGTIEALGVPTGGPREVLLARTLRSFAENFRRFDRRPALLVADSSPPEASLRSSLLALAPELGLPLLYAGKEEKRVFIRQLAECGACSPEVGEFALLDPLGTGFACGSNRNALLLHEAGRMFASADDDVVCRMTLSNGSGWGAYSERDPCARRLYADRASAEKEAAWIELDYLAQHEAVLGRGPGDLGECDLSRAGDDFLRHAAAGEMRVRATFAGHIGDPGIPTSAYYLSYDGENREQLFISEAHYRAALASRSVRMLAARTMLGDATLAPGMATAFDHRMLLPPCFPVLHAEDYSWGAALQVCCPGALLGQLPCAVWHDPPAGKTILQPRDLRPGHRATIFEFAHLLRRLLFVAAPLPHAPAGDRMRAVGHALSDLGALPPRGFREILARHAAQEASARAQQLTRQLEQAPDAPAWWRSDVEHLLQQLAGALDEETGDLPLELQPGEPEKIRDFMQRLVARYGALLQAWPAMVEATLALRDRGLTLLQPLAP